MTDEALLLRYRDEGDEDAFRELVGRYEHELHHYVWRYTHDGSLAEDVSQAALARLAQYCRRFLPGHRVRPWLYSIATHLAIDALRRAGRRPATSLDAEHGDDARLIDILIGRSEDPSAHLEQEEASEWLHCALTQLPDYMREAIDLVYFRGLKYSEAAARLGIPLGTLNSRLHESLVRLRQSAEESRF
jgi:RNA polymerase sigma-70 factor (ECF subfamily)